MTWFGNSLLNLKDQITTLTKEILPEVDENVEQPRFIQIEKFNRLLKICEEKEDQICELQQELDKLRNYEQTASKLQEAGAAISFVNEGVQRPDFQKSKIFEQETEPETVANKNVDSELIVLQSKEHIPSSQNFKNNSEEKQVHNVPEQSIDNLNGRSRLAQLHQILKEVKLAYEREKMKIKSCGSVISFPSSKNSHGTDDTMSNDSERSDDSLLNDFEVLKPRNALTKSLEEFSLSNILVQTSTHLTRSASTQSEFEFSALNKNLQNTPQNTSEIDRKNVTEYDEVEHSLKINLHCWEEVFTKMNAFKNEDIKTCDSYLNSEAFWTELNDLIFKNNEALKHYFNILIQENKSWKQFYQLLNQNEDYTKKRIEKLIDREASLTESIKQKNYIVIKYTNEMNSYFKDLENFNLTLSKIGDEILNKSAELNSIYEEVNTLNKTKDQLSRENEELCEMIKEIRECKNDNFLEKQIEHESEFALLKQQYEILQKECSDQQQTLYSRENELRESRNSLHLLNEELEKTRDSFLKERQQYDVTLADMNEKLSQAELEKDNYKEEAKKEYKKVIDLQSQSDQLEKEIEQWKSTFSNEVDSLNCRLDGLDKQKQETKQNIMNIVHNLAENEDPLFMLKEIVTSLKNYFASSDEEREVWQQIVEFIIKLNCQDEKNKKKEKFDAVLTEQEISKSEQYENENKYLRERITSLECELKQQHDSCAQLRNNTLELENKLGNIAAEREQVIVSLKEKHAESLSYHNELQRVHTLFINEQKKNEEHLQHIQTLKQQLTNNNNAVAELERLRNHLLNMEESYTNELLNSEEQIKDLKNKLMNSEEHIKSINASQISVNVRTNQITESLQQEVKILSEEKEKLSLNLKNCQKELQKNIHDAQNLRSVLDLFHRNKDSEIFQATEKLHIDIKLLQNENQVLEETVRSLQKKIDSLNEISKENDVLCDKIKYKEDIIKRLEVQVKEIQTKFVEAEMKITELNSDSESKFKLNLLKNIILRYVIGNTESMKTQALQILADVLNFTIDEKRKVGLVILDDNKSISAVHKDSLIDEFIRFVEKESDPRKNTSFEESSTK